MTERTLDHVTRHDPRSRGYSVAEAVGDRPLRGRGWALTTQLDQGREGACVGFGWSHELAAAPVRVPVTNHTARLLYLAAQKVDEWDGEDYEGTSVLAGAKAVRALGHIGEYRWCFSLRDVLLALGYEGPVVLGLGWREGMMEADARGFVHAAGDVVGGHCIAAYGASVARRTVQLQNSWGSDWGARGRCRVSWDDLEALLAARGEACVPMQRRPVAA